MVYKVIRPFKDLTDPNKHDYALDETYPRAGHKPSDDFIQGLLTGSNSAGSIFLATIDEEPELQEGDKSTEEEPELPESDKSTEEEPDLPEGDKSTEEEPELPEDDKPADEVPAEKPKRKRTTKKAEE
ncbi:TPA: hypothetical protein U0560_000157 [Streptococcus suis]|uniref:hypothetical protein n=1 Tax=Streptococcus suis TaxID=1307 RepID=UPI00211CBFDE|nr:hypothetical protein [Streptococcus suis]UUM55467.1 hypothetical protein NQZ93_09910 [Streptococcus suis]HEL1804191.1 hypothetical protein [Streptococcus suis]HEL2033308.1 hypothetical protein [Streptococcus suis]HEL2632285.1 hypothetical protein [Streptococcus suis]HEM2688595.1 hypothetical protein [Streptococcus suis]